MKKSLLLFILLLPLQVFAVSNLRLNGSESVTISSLPANVVLTCDLAASGNKINLEIFVDTNMSGSLDPNDMVVDFFTITDGIGWIRDPESPDEDLAGDETGVDAKIKSTFPLEETDARYQAGSFLIKVTDSDGSADDAGMSIVIQPTPPVIVGKITDQTTGSPVPNAIVFASKTTDEVDTESAYGVSNANGDYFMNVTAGDWYVGAVDFIQNKYEHSDTLLVSVGANETKTIDIQLKSYSSFVQGQTKFENGDPVPGILLLALSVESQNVSFINSDMNGNYKLGVSPGQVVLGPSVFGFVFTGQSEWPEGYYADPAADTLTIASGQTATVDFIFKPHTAFIEGDCKVGDAPLPGVEIMAMSMNLQTAQFNMYTTMSDDNGHYKLGVVPGTISMLAADKEGYDMTSPMFGYTNFSVGEGETVTGKNFVFSANSEAMLISGTVKYENNATAGNVYVAAVDEAAESPEGYRILYTDANGFFQFSGLYDGYWKVGVYQDGYVSEPPLFYTDLTYGQQVTNANFTLKTSSGVAPSNALRIPSQFAVMQNYPNPFNPDVKSANTQIFFNLVKPAEVTVYIYNVTGQVVKEFRQGQLNSGQQQILWNGRDDSGKIVPTGIYFYRVQAGNKSQTKRMMIIH